MGIARRTRNRLLGWTLGAAALALYLAIGIRWARVLG